MKAYWKIPGILFLVMALTEIIAVALGYECIHFYLKPWLVPMLALTAGLFLHNRQVKGGMIALVIAALVGHTAGDIFLLSGKTAFFLCGITAFMVGHLFNIIVLNRLLEPFKNKRPSFHRLFIEMLVSFMIPIFLVLMLPQTNVLMTFLVAFYAYVLLTVTRLSGRCITCRVNGAKAAMAGIVLFMISDGTLALNQFMGMEFPFRHAFVMGTYLAAEGLMTYGLCKALTTVSKKG